MLRLTRKLDVSTRAGAEGGEVGRWGVFMPSTAPDGRTVFLLLAKEFCRWPDTDDWTSMRSVM